MHKYLIMLTFCVVTQRIYSKTIFDYNINPQYDLIAQESASYSDYWPSSEYLVDPQIRYKQSARGRGKGHGKRKHELPPNAYDLSHGYDYSAFSEENADEIYDSYHTYHAHEVHPDQAHDHHHGETHGHPLGYPYGQPHGPRFDYPHGKPSGHHPQGLHHGYPHVIPPRFPPPPVYEKDFINPWQLSAVTPKPQVVQQLPSTTPPPSNNQQSSTVTTPSESVSPKLTTEKNLPQTTSSPPSSTTTDDELLYDIDVRFGRE